MIKRYFNYVSLRFRMAKMLDDINNWFEAHPGKPITGEDLQPFLADRQALNFLADAGYIVLSNADNDIYWISRGKGGLLYLVERSELWLNRIASYILGILSAVLAGWIISLL